MQIFLVILVNEEYIQSSKKKFVICHTTFR